MEQEVTAGTFTPRAPRVLEWGPSPKKLRRVHPQNGHPPRLDSPNLKLNPI